MDFLIITGILIFCYSPLYLVEYLHTAKDREALKKLSSDYPGSRLIPSAAPSLKGAYKGQKFLIKATHPIKTVNQLRIFLQRPAAFKLTALKKEDVRVFSKKIKLSILLRPLLGIAHQIKSNDFEFDKKFDIFSDGSSQASAYIGRDSTRKIIAKLLNQDIDRVTIGKKEILIQQDGFDCKTDLTFSRVNGILSDLSSLVS